MKKGQRYDVSGLVEAQFEPGSRGRVLKNLLGIKAKREMDQVEQREQLRALEELVGKYGHEHRFSAADVCKIHKIWLGPVYEWEGRYRQVNLSKGDFPFASAQHIPRLMMEFENGPLRQFTPCRFQLKVEIVRSLVAVHTELVLIHPFREGNGRVARLLASLMGAQAGLPLLNFDGLRSHKKRQDYFAAVRAGLGHDYKPMEKIFTDVVDKSLSAPRQRRPSQER